jgi:hypothetical protein
VAFAFFAFFAFFALRFLARFAIVCLLADLGLRFRVPEVFFDALLRLETGFLAGRGFEGEISFGLIPKMPIMGLVESLLGIGFRIKQPASTYRLHRSHLAIGMADFAGWRAACYDLLSSHCNAKRTLRLTTKIARAADARRKMHDISYI